MAEYIKCEDAIKLIEEDKVEITPILLAIVGTYTAEQAFDGINQTCDRHIESIKKLPTADVQPVVHGEWRWKSSTYDREPCEMRFKCSICSHEVVTYGQDPSENYCPNCGARMRGSNEQEK